MPSNNFALSSVHYPILEIFYSPYSDEISSLGWLSQKALLHVAENNKTGKFNMLCYRCTRLKCSQIATRDSLAGSCVSFQQVNVKSKTLFGIVLDEM
ncbi:CLUMA_CG018361, isoform A [Clunio marinus]|uniref:CLUMA_CG018361, isoform A n=1 Tax=Clunio marinus TaxID=568069 RepID=A0A1J1IZV1_9DIPT|nr:CLUMA_CG018361, isoform A [Clunio marinus]